MMAERPETLKRTLARLAKAKEKERKARFSSDAHGPVLRRTTRRYAAAKKELEAANLRAKKIDAKLWEALKEKWLLEQKAEHLGRVKAKKKG